MSVEDGRLVVIDIDDPQSVSLRFKSSGEPLWSLAYNPTRKMLAVGERMGRIRILDTSTSEFVELVDTHARIPKRMKWPDSQTLIVTHSDRLDRAYEP